MFLGNKPVKPQRGCCGKVWAGRADPCCFLPRLCPGGGNCESRMTNSFGMRNWPTAFPPGWMKALRCIHRCLGWANFQPVCIISLQILTCICLCGDCFSWLVSRHFWGAGPCQLRWRCLPCHVLSFHLAASNQCRGPRLKVRWWWKRL